MALNGSLDDYSPAGALRVLSSTGKTGAVRFSGSAACTAYLSDGQLYFARGEGTDDALASALVRPGRLTADAWTRAVEEAGDSPRVGQLLIDQGGIDSDLLASIVLSVIYDPLITLFREGDGRFDFEPGTMHWIGPYRGFNVEAIVNEVRRRVRNVDEMSEVVPSTSAWVSPVRSLPDGASQVTLLREDWELVTALSGPRTVDELADTMGRGRYSTAQVVHRLARAGLLDVMAEPFTTDDAAVHEPTAEERLAGSHPAEPASDIDDLVDIDEAEDRDSVDIDEPVDIDEAEDREPATEGATDRDPAEVTATPDGADDPIADAGTALDGTDVHDDDGDTWGGDGTAELDEEAAWAAITAGNPFDHAPGDDPEPAIAFGPAIDGAAGTESGADALALLPRRTAVQEADPPDDPEEAPAWAAIAGFHDPTAEVRERQDAAVASVADEATNANAAWLEDLYAQFIDEPSVENGKARKKEALDVAFQAEEQDRTEKVGTLKRLAAALRRL